MKKGLLISSISMFALLGVLVASNQEQLTQVVKAEQTPAYVFDGEMDMSKDPADLAPHWYASEGKFVTVDDWLYSNKGVSFEFKFKNAGAPKEMIIMPTCDGNHLCSTTNKCYMMANNNGEPTSFNKDSNNKIGHITKLTGADDGWYRYDLLFAELGGDVKPENAHKTLNGVKFLWVNANGGYWNDLFVRKMKVITPEEYGHIDISTLGKTYCFGSGHCHAFPTFKNFYNQDKGFFITFKYSNNVHFALAKEYTNDNKVADPISGAFYMIDRNAQTGVATTGCGKLISLGNDVYRYELMPSTLKNSAYYLEASSTTDFRSIIFDWGVSGNGLHEVYNFGYIDDYSVTAAFHYDTTDIPAQTFFDGSFELPTIPEVTGKHFNWYSDSLYQAKADFSDLHTVGGDYYGRYEDHVFTEYDFDANQHWQICECNAISTKVDHTFNLEVEDAKYLCSAASCQHGNIYFKSCVCGCASTTETFDDGNISGTHVYGEAETVVLTEPTCTEQGSWETHKLCECGEKQVIESGTIEKLNHDYEEKTWTLSDDKTSATLTLVCKNDPSEEVTVDATVTKNVVNPTLEKEGANIYTLSADYDGKHYSKVITEPIAKLEPTIPDEPEEPETKGCGGSIIAASSLITSMSIIGISFLYYKKRKEF